MEATKKIEKKERRGHTTIPFERSTLILHLISLYSIEIIIHAYNFVGILYTIELGLYIPMMSLLKRALGLLEQASWMHPHLFHWRDFHSSHVHPLHGNPYSSHHIYHLAFSRL